MKLNELLTANVSILNQLTKAEAEIIAKVAALEAAVEALNMQLANVELTPEQADSVVDLQEAAQALDDINPDSAPS